MCHSVLLSTSYQPPVVVLLHRTKENTLWRLCQAWGATVVTRQELAARPSASYFIHLSVARLGSIRARLLLRFSLSPPALGYLSLFV